MTSKKDERIMRNTQDNLVLRTPEELKERSFKPELSPDIVEGITILGSHRGRLGVSSKYYVSGFTEQIQLVNLDDPEDTSDIPIWRPNLQISIAYAYTWQGIADRLNRLGHNTRPVTAEWVKLQYQRKGIPLYFAEKLGHQGFLDDEENEWLVFKSYKQANFLNVRKLNAYLKKKGSRYRIVKKQVILHEA